MYVHAIVTAEYVDETRCGNCLYETLQQLLELVGLELKNKRNHQIVSQRLHIYGMYQDSYKDLGFA